MKSRTVFSFNIGQVIALRRRLGLSPQKFAQAAGIPPQMVHQWENLRTSKPSARSLEILANTFGVDINYFFIQTEHRKDDQPSSAR